MSVLIMIIPLLIFLGCAPELNIEPVNNKRSLLIEVQPDSVERTVIIKDALPVDTFILKEGTSEILVDPLSFGTYGIIASATGFGTSRREILLNFNTPGQRIYLRRFPEQLNRYEPVESTLLRSGVFKFWFRTIFGETTMRRLVRFTPEIGFRVDTVVLDTDQGHFVQITAHPADLLQHDSVTITLSDTVVSLLNEVLEFPFIRTYRIDRSQMQRSLIDYYLAEYYPSGKFINSSEELRFSFHSAVIDSTLKSGIRIEPAVEGTLDLFNSFDRQYRFIPGNDLRCDQTYRVTLDSTVQFEDLTYLQGGLSWEFTTLPLRFDASSSYPQNGTTMAVRDKPFLLVFSSPIDSLSIVNGFSIEPPLDSLNFSLTESRDSVFVSHALLDTDTSYTLTLDRTITDRHGSNLLLRVDISFRAE